MNISENQKLKRTIGLFFFHRMPIIRVNVTGRNMYPRARPEQAQFS